jgi:hypothetical protein
MSISKLSEVSFRAGVVLAQQELRNNESLNLSRLSDLIRNHALRKIEMVQQSENILNGLKSADGIQSVAINAGIAGIQMAYSVMSMGAKEAKAMRKQFVQECEKNLATFYINHDKEHHEYSNEERMIKIFQNMIQNYCSDFIDYFGIQITLDPIEQQICYYSVLPFFLMSKNIEQHLQTNSELETTRLHISQFLKAGLPINQYYDIYKGQTKSGWLHFVGVFSLDNYLNQFRGPRFILTALANLLWNLQYPVDPTTGIPFNNIECKRICEKAQLFLNALLAESQHLNHIKKIDNEQKLLFIALKNIDTLIYSLGSAFNYELLHEINLREITKHMHQALKLISKKLFELITQNENSADLLISQILILCHLFKQCPDLYACFNDYRPNDNLDLLLNQQQETIVDILIIFCHLTPATRKSFLNNLIDNPNENFNTLGCQLKQLNDGFLVPLEKNAIANLNLSLKPLEWERSHIYKDTASYFLPLLFLILQSHSVLMDIEFQTQELKDTTSNSNVNLSNQVQIDEILKNAFNNTYPEFTNTEGAFEISSTHQTQKLNYHFSLSNFLKKKNDTHQNLDEILKWQYKMFQQTTRLDAIANAIEFNRIALLKPVIQEKINLILENIRATYKQLNDNFNSYEDQLPKMSRDEKHILQPMLEGLDETLKAINISITQIQKILISPEFINHAQESISSKNYYGTLGLFSLSPKKMQTESVKNPLYNLIAQRTETVTDSETPSLKLEEHLVEEFENPVEEDNFFYYLMQYGLMTVFCFAGTLLTVNLSLPLFTLGFGLNLLLAIGFMATGILMALSNDTEMDYTQATIYSV